MHLSAALTASRVPAARPLQPSYAASNSSRSPLTRSPSRGVGGSMSLPGSLQHSDHEGNTPRRKKSVDCFTTDRKSVQQDCSPTQKQQDWRGGQLLQAPAAPEEDHPDCSLEELLGAELDAVQASLTSRRGNVVALAASHTEDLRRREVEVRRLQSEAQALRLENARLQAALQSSCTASPSGPGGATVGLPGESCQIRPGSFPPVPPPPAAALPPPPPTCDPPLVIGGGLSAGRPGRDGDAELPGAMTTTPRRTYSEPPVPPQAIGRNTVGSVHANIENNAGGFGKHSHRESDISMGFSVAAEEESERDRGSSMQLAVPRRGLLRKQPSADISSEASVDGKSQRKQFHVLSIWTDNLSKVSGGTAKSKKVGLGNWSNRSGNLTMMEVAGIGDDDEGEVQQNGRPLWWVLPPLSKLRLALDLSSFVLVIWDMIMIPLDLLDPPKTDFTDFMVWVTRVYWTMDMFLSFCKGYLGTDGTIEQRPKVIIRRYLTTWFVFDFTIVGLDWMELFMSGAEAVGYARVGRASRSFRVVRLLRLLRLVRLQEGLTMMAERINSRKQHVLMDMVKTVMALLSMAHLIGCIWYGVGARDGVDVSWVKTYGFEGAPLGDRYAMSLHWSLTQFSGGMDEITAENVGERVLNIFVFTFCFLMGVLFLSNLTSSMTQLNLVGNSHAQALALLRQYLVQNKVSRRLLMRVTRNAVHALQEQERHMPEDKVEMLGIVSEPLRMELHFESFSPSLRSHEFFCMYIDQFPQVMRRVCHYATSASTVSRGDVVFSAGETPLPPTMYFICSGILRYEIPSKHQSEVEEGQYIAEATLWTKWTHLGTLVATSHCRLLRLNADEFQRIASMFEHGQTFNPMWYATEFVESLNSTGELSDLPASVVHATG